VAWVNPALHTSGCEALSHFDGSPVIIAYSCHVLPCGFVSHDNRSSMIAIASKYAVLMQDGYGL
jgi:hypothetical protein